MRCLYVNDLAVRRRLTAECFKAVLCSGEDSVEIAMDNQVFQVLRGQPSPFLRASFPFPETTKRVPRAGSFASLQALSPAGARNWQALERLGKSDGFSQPGACRFLFPFHVRRSASSKLEGTLTGSYTTVATWASAVLYTMCSKGQWSGLILVDFDAFLRLNTPTAKRHIEGVTLQNKDFLVAPGSKAR